MSNVKVNNYFHCLCWDTIEGFSWGQGLTAPCFVCNTRNWYPVTGQKALFGGLITENLTNGSKRCK